MVVSSRTLLLALCAVLCVLTQPASGASSASKIAKLNAAQAAAGGPRNPLLIDDSLFSLVYEKPRNFSAVVVFTALDPRHNCGPCVQFETELKLITQAWGRAYVPNSFYITKMDFSEATQAAFQKLQLRNVPFVALFPPTEGPLFKGKSNKEYESYDVSSKGLDAEAFAAWIERNSDVKLTIRRPINWAMYGTFAFFGTLTVILLRVFSDVFWGILSNKSLWIVGSLGSSIFFCAGHMWNTIRTPEYAGTRDGKTELFAGGFQNQYVVESQIMAVLYAVTAVSFVVLTTKIPLVRTPELQRLAFFGAFVPAILLYSLLLRIFRAKNPGYPFRLI